MMIDYSQMQQEGNPIHIQIHYGFLRASLDPDLVVVRAPVAADPHAVPPITAVLGTPIPGCFQGVAQPHPGTVMTWHGPLPANMETGKAYHVLVVKRSVTVTGKVDHFEAKVVNELAEVINNHPLDSIDWSQVSDLKTISLRERSSSNAVPGAPVTIYRPTRQVNLKWTFNRSETLSFGYSCAWKTCM